YALAYEDDAVRIWENTDALPRAFVSAIGDFDGALPQLEPAAITAATGREKLVDVAIDEPAQLVVLETNTPGWRAYIRPQGAGEDAEVPIEVALYAGNFQRVTLPEAGAWTVRLVYSPASFQIGLFISFISGLLLVF